MRNKLIACAPVLCALLALAGFTYRKAEAPKWEFQIVTFSVSPDDNADEKTINHDGRDGWELVTVERSGTRRTYFFKRPL
jgi:hypothetical protein